MTYSSDDILKLIHDTKALQIWNRQKGPVFWYVLGVPGPFFVNTEWIIGKELSLSILHGINSIMEKVSDPASRAQQLTSLIMTAYKDSEDFRNVVAALVKKATQELPAGSYSLISGGERRDWIFSIPFAQETALRHVFLFKDKSFYCERPFEPEEKVLHVADLINNAASYFDRWLPALRKAHLVCHKTTCVVSRNHGDAKLEEIGIESVPLIRIDLSFFEKSRASGLIDKDTLDEITTHFHSPQRWAEKYLFNNPGVLDVQKMDAKSFERFESFITQDPWALREVHHEFFDAMRRAIAVRKKNAA